MKSVQHKVLSH